MNFLDYLQHERITVFWFMVLGYGLAYFFALIFAWFVYTLTKRHRRWTVERMVFTAYTVSLGLHLILSTYYSYTKTMEFWVEGRWDFMLWTVPYWTVVILDIILALILWKQGSNSYFISSGQRRHTVESETV